MRTTRQRRKRASRSEREVATDLGGRRTFLSGAGEEKADGRAAHRYQVVGGQREVIDRVGFRIENKTTESTKFTLSADMWGRTWRAAMADCEIPLFHIELDILALRLALLVIPLATYCEVVGAPRYQDGQPRKSLTINKARWLGAEALVGSGKLSYSYVLDDRGNQHEVCLCRYQAVLPVLQALRDI